MFKSSWHVYINKSLKSRIFISIIIVFSYIQIIKSNREYECFNGTNGAAKGINTILTDLGILHLLKWDIQHEIIFYNDEILCEAD